MSKMSGIREFFRAIYTSFTTIMFIVGLKFRKQFVHGDPHLINLHVELKNRILTV